MKSIMQGLIHISLKTEWVYSSVQHFSCVAGASYSRSNMVVPTLPVIGVPPSIELFLRLEALSTIIVLACVVATMVSFCVLVFRALLYCVNKCRVAIRKCQRGCCCRCEKTNKYCWTPGQRQRDCYHRCMNTVFEVLGRWLCVNTFPALFKLHKTRSRQDKSQMRTFMVFLDREVESSVVLVVAFCCLAISILCISTLVFFQYFPVEESGICLEKDGYGRPLFCYINSSIPKYPNLPVDCANYTVTELRKIEFTCYVLAFPGLGIAVAAAFGLAKMAAVAVTLYVKMTEAFFNMTQNLPHKRPWWCCCRKLSRKNANKIYIYLSWALLTIVLAISPISIIIFISYDETDPSRGLLRYYFASMLLPAQLCLPLMYIIHHLKSHCEGEEYASLAEDQKTPVPSHCNEESEPPTTAREQDEESAQRVNSRVNREAPGENEELLLSEAMSSVSSSTECTNLV